MHEFMLIMYFLLQVKVLFVRNLHTMTTEETLRQIFSAHGYIERVKKQNDYAFIHFRERQDAEQAISARNGKEPLVGNHSQCGVKQ